MIVFTALWMLTWLLLPATFISAVVVADWRGFRPNREKLVRSALMIGGLLLFCLIPNLIIAPQVRHYPSIDEVGMKYLVVSAIGLGAMVLMFGMATVMRTAIKKMAEYL